jgi:EAL domain-containing protein (putative c-di-GMP-specific phosphodiesterase class I)
VIRLSHALGLRVVAEGVETAAQNDILLQMGCDELQGYHFARPMSADALQAWAQAGAGAAPGARGAGTKALAFSDSVLGHN